MIRSILILSLVACSATARHTALSTTTASLDAAQVGFVAYDATHQLDIVAGCSPTGTKLACEAKLVDYRTRREAVMKAVVAAYEAVAAAWKLDTEISAANAIQAGVAVERAIKLLVAEGTP